MVSKGHASFYRGPLDHPWPVIPASSIHREQRQETTGLGQCLVTAKSSRRLTTTFHLLKDYRVSSPRVGKLAMSNVWSQTDRWGDREITLFLINIKRVRLRHWNKKVKTKKPEQLAPSHLLLDVKLEKQGDLKGLSASFLFEMLTSYKAPGMGRRKDCQREVLKHTYCPCILGRPGWHLPFLKTQLSHPDPLS
jgi:hypothetical protein